jgi:pyruvate dehydrogenase E1 component alpha subunit
MSNAGPVGTLVADAGGAGFTWTRSELEDFDEGRLVFLLREMLFYRRFEQKAEEAYAIGKIGGFCHLHIGQEAVAAGGILPLRPDDYVITAYRDHTQALAKGVEPNAVMAELYGRAGGTSGGKGGSMHIFDASVRFMGGHGIVGAHIPLAAGFAFKAQYREEDVVTVCFMGDAAVNQGSFLEALNMAAVWQLPVIYIVENNHYGMGTAFSRVSRVPLAERSKAFGIPAHRVDGQDVLATHSLMEHLVARVRAGDGPQFVDMDTYRFKGHSMSDPVSGTYRSKEEVQSVLEGRDPITVLADRLIEAGIIDREKFETMDKEVRELSDAAAEYADAQPLPDPEMLTKHVWAEINPNGRLFFDGRGDTSGTGAEQDNG